MSSGYYGVSDEFIMYVIVPAVVLVVGYSISKLMEICQAYRRGEPRVKG